MIRLPSPVVINLDEATDRWQNMVAKLTVLGMKPIRLRATEPRDVSRRQVDVYLEAVPVGGRSRAVAYRRLACTDSHRRALEQGDLVMEDDAVFAPDFWAIWKQFFVEVPEDWQVILLGAAFVHSGRATFERLSSSCIRVLACTGRHAYLVREEAKSLLTSVWEGQAPGDVLWNQVHAMGRSYAPLPTLAVQASGRSQIELRHADNQLGWAFSWADADWDRVPIGAVYSV